MKFKITRASHGADDEINPHVPGAYQETKTVTYFCQDEQKEMTTSCWYVDVESLDALTTIIKNADYKGFTKEVAVGPDFYESIYSIEICDDYRE